MQQRKVARAAADVRVPRRPSRRILLVSLGILLLVVSLWSLTGGAVETSAKDVFVALSPAGGGESSEMSTMVIRQIRLPRLLSGILVGAGLTLAGAMLQGLFRNPLADPALIGVSSGAAMGGALAVVALPVALQRLAGAGLAISASVAGWLDWVALPLFSMAGAVGLAFAIYRVSLVRGRTHVPAMLLTGIAVNAISGAFVGLLVTVFASDDQLRAITFWTLGSMAGANWTTTTIIAILILPGTVLALRYGQSLNSFLLGEGEAFHLGVNVQRVKRVVIVLSAVMVGATVAFCGIIGFVGLVVPHIIRTLFGPDHRLLLPAGALLGGTILVAADVFARTLLAPSELQIGILTALLGGPFFLGLLIRARKDGNSPIGS